MLWHTAVALRLRGGRDGGSSLSCRASGLLLLVRLSHAIADDGVLKFYAALPIVASLVNTEY